jgi:hypothetical protein
MAARTARQRAQLKRAQIISARKRKGRGRGKAVSRKAVRRTAKPSRALVRKRTLPSTKTRSAKSIRRRKIARNVAIGAVAVGAIGAVGYRHRENLVIKHVAVTRALKSHRKKAKASGRKLSNWEIQYIKEQERHDHAHRSTFRVREYREARRVAKLPTSRGRSMRPDRANSAWSAGVSVTGHPVAHRNYVFEAYRKDVHSRAVARHGRMTGKKRRFNYSSGKRLTVLPGGKVKREFW